MLVYQRVTQITDELIRLSSHFRVLYLFVQTCSNMAEKLVFTMVFQYHIAVTPLHTRRRLGWR